MNRAALSVVAVDTLDLLLDCLNLGCFTRKIFHKSSHNNFVFLARLYFFLFAKIKLKLHFI